MAGKNSNVDLLFSAFKQSPTQKQTNNDVAACICSRPIQDVLCRACGYVFTGRTRKQCAFHPMAIHLMDCGNCPRCKNTYLHEFRPSKKVNQVNMRGNEDEELNVSLSSLSSALKDKAKIMESSVESKSKLSVQNSKQGSSLNNTTLKFVKSNSRDKMEDLGLSERR